MTIYSTYLIIGLDSDKGTPSVDGIFYYATDTDKLYVASGGSWNEVSASVSAHASTHVDGGSDEIVDALDPRAYPMLADTIANRPSAGIEGRFFWSTDEHILYRDNGSSWDKVAVADHDDLSNITENDHHNRIHGVSDHDASAKGMKDTTYATTSLTPTTGAWTDLLSISRTLNESRIAIILGGFVIYAGSSEIDAQTRILIDGSHVETSWRIITIPANKKAYLQTHMIYSLSSGSHTIKLQYYVSGSGTIYDRHLGIAWIS